MYDNIEINYYEPIYQCLCSDFSVAYLKGSSFYVGDSLRKWYNENILNEIFLNNNNKLNSNLKKLYYIIDILDEWIQQK